MVFSMHDSEIFALFFWLTNSFPLSLFNNSQPPWETFLLNSYPTLICGLTSITQCENFYFLWLQLTTVLGRKQFKRFLAQLAKWWCMHKLCTHTYIYIYILNRLINNDLKEYILLMILCYLAWLSNFCFFYWLTNSFPLSLLINNCQPPRETFLLNSYPTLICWLTSITQCKNFHFYDFN